VSAVPYQEGVMELICGYCGAEITEMYISIGLTDPSTAEDEFEKEAKFQHEQGYHVVLMPTTTGSENVTVTFDA
jgi:hypothetical protein